MPIVKKPQTRKTLVTLRETQIKALDDIAALEIADRSAIVRRAVDAYLAVQRTDFLPQEASA
jgi:hypothetical protein